MRAAFVWSRPDAVLVEEGSETKRLRVPDRTRQIQWALLAAGLLAGSLAAMRRRRRRRRRLFGR